MIISEDCIMILMLGKIIDFFKKRPGLVLLMAILSIITVVNIKPDFYLLGWDNYSSYFNLKTNIFRTFFSTWREYRGLGVPSDSESTDLFRQLFFLILSPFFKANLFDQIFSLFSFNLGILLIYGLSKKIFKDVFNNEKKLDLLGLSAGIFYIFNLNTLATFYFPMIMYVNRFYTVPLLFYIFIDLIKTKLTWKKICIYSLLIIFSSGTYMTATIFITILVSLGIFVLIQSQNLKKSIIFILFFVLLNSFWLFPFINYTISKSGIVYQAPTFIDANEIQLNKPASFYNLQKQLILYPNFFDTTVSSFDGSQSTGIHPLSNLFDKFPYNFVLAIFPLFYLSGAILLFFKFKTFKKLFWISLLILLYLFLSLKAFSPLGFIYIFLEKTIPFFGSLFRFGDTKFHYFISFAGSLSAGFFAVKIIERLNRRNTILLFGTLLTVLIIVFSSYFNSHFFGFFDLNKLPDAYFQVATMINSDQEDFRVLHLPFNQDRYWRSYNWGYLGSSFFHFLINKPLLEKTFEPASQENVELNQEVYDKIVKNSDDLYYLLKKTGVKYIIFDETVSPQMTTKGLGAWGTYNYFESQQALEKLESEGLISKKAVYNLKITDYLDIYEKVFPLTKDDLDLIKKTPDYKIILYTLKDPDPKFRLIRNYNFTDPKAKEINNNQDKDTLQNDNTDFQISPFKRKDLKFTVNDNRIETNIDNFIFKDGLNYEIKSNNNNFNKPQTVLEVNSRIDDKNLYLDFYSNPLPKLIFENEVLDTKSLIKEISIPLDTISGMLELSGNLDNYLSNWSKALPYKSISKLRLKIGDNIIPLPTSLNDRETYIGSLILNQGLTKIELLAGKSLFPVDLKNIKLTENPNCFSDKLDYYSSSVDYINGFNLKSQNGSSCFTLPVKDYLDQKANYIEINLNYLSESLDLDKQYLNDSRTSKPVLQSVIKSLNKPNYLYSCIKDANVDDCFNSHEILSLQSDSSVTIPSDREINAYDPLVFFALKNTGYQSQSLVIKNISIRSFKVVANDDLNIFSEEKGVSFMISKPQELKLSFNLPMNYYSFYQNDKDGFNVSNGLCTSLNSYRTFRLTDRLVSYFNGCDNNFFTTLDFDSNNSYIWSVDYNLVSGKFPRFNLGDEFNKYTNQILSLYQGYPDIREFKTFQNPEFFADKDDTSSKFDRLTLTNTSLILSNDPTIDDQKKKNFMIAQDSENEGIAVYDNFNVIQIPNIWNSLSIEPTGNFYSLESSDNIGYQQILPSLWKVNSESPFSNQILLFNEGFDKQWGVYDSLLNLLIGKKAETSLKCNNYANCFEISSTSNNLYIFYTPERLYFLGWAFTLLAVFLGKRIVSN
jgi:hypothetical protein